MTPRKKSRKPKKKPRHQLQLPMLKLIKPRRRQLRARPMVRLQQLSTKKLLPRKFKNRKMMPKSKSRKLKKKRLRL